MFDVDRILAIADLDDAPQMGLSRSGLAALVERGGIRKDGIKAKSSVLKLADKASIKGDKKLSENTSLTSDQAQKIKGAIARSKKGVSPSDRVTKETTPYEAAKDLGIKTANGKRISAKTKPDVIKKAIERDFAEKNAARYLEAGKKNKLPQYEKISDADVKSFAGTVYENKFAVDDRNWTFNARAFGGGTDFSKYVEAGLLEPRDNANRHQLTRVGKEFAKNVLLDMDNGRIQKQAETVLTPKKQPSAIIAPSATPKSRKVVKGVSPRDRKPKALAIKTFKDLESEASKKGLKVEKVAKSNIRSSHIVFKDKDNKVVARTSKNVEDAAKYFNNPYAKHNTSKPRTIVQMPDEELGLTNSPSTGTKTYNRAVNKYDNYRKNSSH